MSTQRELLKESLSWLNRAVSVFIAEHEINGLIEEIEAELAKPEQEHIGFISSKAIRNLKNGLAAKCIVFVEKNDSAVNPIYALPEQNEIVADELLKNLESAWPASFALQPKTKEERHDVLFIQQLKKDAAKEIRRLQEELAKTEHMNWIGYDHGSDDDRTEIYTSPQPEQKPAWLAVEVDDKTQFFNPDMLDYAKDFNRPITKLYKEPQYEPLSELLVPEVIECSAKALFESGEHKMLAAAGYATDWDGQPNTLKLDYRRKARTVIKTAIEKRITEGKP